MIAKKKNKSNLIKILCVLLGAVFALSTSYVFAAFSWSHSHNSGYSTGAYLPNQSYQIINDTLPNGVPFGAGAKEYEVALQYSYDYSFYFYLEYSLVWVKTSGSTSSTTTLDTSNVILTYSNRDAWIVDNSRIYYRDAVAAGTGKLTAIVGVDFADLNDETYFGHSLQINIKAVKISQTAAGLDKTGVAGTAWNEYQARKLTSYTTSAEAYVVVYNPTDKGDYQPKAPVGKTAFRSGAGVTTISQSDSTSTATTETVPIKQIWGNKNYVGLGAYVITGSAAVNLKARLVGSWAADEGTTTKPSDVYVVSNTIKYDFADNWTNETYDESTQVQEIRTYSYTIPAHTAVYIPIVDSVELTTRGYYANANYSGFHIKTQLELNDAGNIETTDGIGATTIATTAVSGATSMPTNTYSVYNRSSFDAALYQSITSTTETYSTNIMIVNNTANKLSIGATFSLKVFVSNGNSTAAYGSGAQDKAFEDSTYWVRDIQTLTSDTNITVDSVSNLIVAPYSAATICTQFTIPPDMYANLVSLKTKYAGSDVWCVLVPTITQATSTATDSRLTLQTEVVNNQAQLYVKNNSTSVISAYNLAVTYKWLNTQNESSYSQTVLDGSTQTKPDNWERIYWKYYTKTNNVYTQNTTSGWTSSTYYLFNGWETATKTSGSKTITINPGEKVWYGSISLNGSQIYDFSDATLTGTVTTSVSDVQLINETTGLTYLINKSTTKSYYVRFNATATGSFKDYFFVNGSYSYYYGLIRPGQVIPIGSAATTDVVTVNTIEDTTGRLLTSAEFTAKGWADVRSNFESMYK